MALVRSRWTWLVALLALAGCGEEEGTSTLGAVPSARPWYAGPEAPADPPAGTVRGVLGGYERGRVWGWAQRMGSSEPVEVEVRVDGVVVARALADRPREDLLRKGLHPTGHAGFELQIDPELDTGTEVEAFVEGGALGGGACVVQGSLGVTSCTEGTVRGSLGGARDGRVWGWAQVIGQTQPARVRIEVDGEVATTVVANRPRADLLDKGLHPTGRAGFEARLPLAEGARVVAIVEGAPAPLHGGPVVVVGGGAARDDGRETDGADRVRRPAHPVGPSSPARDR